MYIIKDRHQIIFATVFKFSFNWTPEYITFYHAVAMMAVFARFVEV